MSEPNSFKAEVSEADAAFLERLRKAPPELRDDPEALAIFLTSGDREAVRRLRVAIDEAEAGR